MYPIICQNNYRYHVLLSMIGDLLVSNESNCEYIAYKYINPQLSCHELYGNPVQMVEGRK